MRRLSLMLLVQWLWKSKVWLVGASVVALLVEAGFVASADSATSIGGKIIEIRGLKRSETRPATTNPGVSSGGQEGRKDEPRPSTFTGPTLASAELDYFYVPPDAEVQPGPSTSVEFHFPPPQFYYGDHGSQHSCTQPTTSSGDTKTARRSGSQASAIGSDLRTTTTMASDGGNPETQSEALPCPTVIATPGDLNPEICDPLVVRNNLITTPIHGSALDSKFSPLVVLSLSIGLASFALATLCLALVLRRLSLLQSSTLRVELAEPSYASLRAVAASLVQNGQSEYLVSRHALAGLEAERAGSSSAYEHRSLHEPDYAEPSRATRIADLTDSATSLAADWAGPTFATAQAEAEASCLQREGEILQHVFNQNLQLMAGLKRIPKTVAA